MVQRLLVLWLLCLLALTVFAAPGKAPSHRPEETGLLKSYSLNAVSFEPENERFGLLIEALGLQFLTQDFGRGQVACDAPFSLTPFQIFPDSVRLTWSHSFPGNVTSYELEIRPRNQGLSGVPTHTGILAAPFTVAGLESGRDYRCKIRAICGGDTSLWSSLNTDFRTLLSNPSRCGASYALADGVCPAPAAQRFSIFVQAAGNSLGQDTRLRAVRLLLDHPWRFDLQVDLVAPDGTSVRLIEGMNAGDSSLGNPNLPCPAYIELTNDPGTPPFGSLHRVQFPVGRYQPFAALAPLNNGQNPNGVWRLDICDLRIGRAGTFRWAELVFEDLACLPPQGILATNADLNSAEIDWPAAPANCGDSLVVEWGERGFLPGDRASAGQGRGLLRLACPVSFPLQIAGLESFKWYEVYLRRKCTNGSWSANSAPARFFTDCQPTLAEDFESQNTCSQTYNAPCQLGPGLWQNMTAGDQFDWKIWQGSGPGVPKSGPYTDADGDPNGQYLYFETTIAPGSNTNGKTAMLRSGCLLVQASPGQTCQFAFDYFMWNNSTASGGYGRLALDISLNNGISWTNLVTIQGVQSKGWKHIRVPLEAWHGQVAVFRFTATGTTNQDADIMLDNLNFYGSTDAGAPDFVFFHDADGDQFGNAADSLVSCTPTLPPGYVLDKTDCDDADASHFPGASELVCNGADENCNGPADDTFIAEPLAADTAVCSGMPLVLRAKSPAKGTFYWFAEPAGGLPIATGEQLLFQNFSQTGTFYLADSVSGAGQGCSSARLPVQAEAWASPVLVLDTAAYPKICRGQSFDLSMLPVLDFAGANGQFTWHTATPPNPANRLSGPVVNPTDTRNYFVLSTTPQGCTDAEEVLVKVNPTPTAVVTAGELVQVCKNGLKRLVVNANGGTPPYRYAWDNGYFFQTKDVRGDTLPANGRSFVAVVTDSLGCTGADLIEVQPLQSVTSTEITFETDVSTCGGSDGQIGLTPLDGQAPYNFEWPGGSLTGVTGTGIITNLKQGSYRITVTDGSLPGGECRMVMPLIVLDAPGLSVGVPNVQHPACAAAATGSIALRVQGTQPTFLWSNGHTTQNLVNIGPDFYSVTITDGACQQVLKNLEVAAPEPIDILTNQIRPVSCFGGSDGAVDIAIFGGTPATSGYSVAWSNNLAGEDIQNVSAGNFSCIVTDANGCSRTANFAVPEPPPLQTAATLQADVRCNGGSDGEIFLQTTGGTGNYAYAWSHGTNTPRVANLVAGNYTATVTDANGCTATFSGAVAEPPLLRFDSISVKNPLCVGANDGRLVPHISGGVPAYTLTWNTGSSAQVLDNLGNGHFSVTVSDAHQCQTASDFIVFDPPQLLDLALDSLSPVRCFGEDNGKIFTTLTGGVGPYTVKWNQFQTDQFFIENLFPGDFTAFVRDSRGCQISRSFQITEPAAPLGHQILVQNNPVCFGEYNGAIGIGPTGGTAPYRYLWDNGATTPNLGALPAGTYALTISDARGCTDTTGTLSLTQLPAIEPFVKINPVRCGETFGSIVLDSVRGGAPDYRYLWSRGDTTASVYFLLPGLYKLSVTDSRGCAIETDSLEIVNTSTDFALAAEAVENTSCFGTNDGQIVVSLHGGEPPFTFSWSHLPDTRVQNQPRDTVSGLFPGTYFVAVFDADGCTAFSQIFEIQEKPPLRILNATTTNNPCKGQKTGEIELEIAGGLPPYTFVWSHGSAEASPDSLLAGNYQATLTDLDGCTLVTPIFNISEPPTGVHILVDQLTHEFCNSCSGEIDQHPANGVPPYFYRWSNDAESQDLQSLCPGDYTVTVTDDSGCTTSASYTILPDTLKLTLDTTYIRDLLCAGDSDGSISVQMSGGLPDYTFAWDVPGAFGPSVDGLSGGNYNLSVTDLAGCTKFYNFQIYEPDSIRAEAATDSTATGWSIDLTVSHATPPFDIRWFDAALNFLPGGAVDLPSGLYFAEITDSNGCQVRLPFRVGTVAAPEQMVFEKLAVSPNPSAGLFWLDLKMAQPGELAVEIFTARGELAQRAIFSEKRAAWFLPFDLSAAAPGVFWLKVRAGFGAERLTRIVVH